MGAMRSERGGFPSSGASGGLLEGSDGWGKDSGRWQFLRWRRQEAAQPGQAGKPPRAVSRETGHDRVCISNSGLWLLQGEGTRRSQEAGVTVRINRHSDGGTEVGRRERWGDRGRQPWGWAGQEGGARTDTRWGLGLGGWLKDGRHSGHREGGSPGADTGR